MIIYEGVVYKTEDKHDWPFHIFKIHLNHTFVTCVVMYPNALTSGDS